MLTDKDLRSAEAAYRAAFRRAEKLRRQRNQLVLDALEAGWTHAAVAAATGLSRGRVNQIARSR